MHISQIFTSPSFQFTQVIAMPL